LGGASQLFGFLSSINGELYGQALSSALSQYRIWDPSFALARDVEAYEKLNRDPVVSHATYLRKLGAAGTRWAIVPVAPSALAGAAAKLTEAALSELDDFLALRFNLGEGIVQGSRWARVWWETRRVPLPEGVVRRDGQPAAEVELVCPVVHRDVDKRRFRQYRVTRPDVEKTPQGVDENGELSFEKVAEYPWQVWRPVQRVWQDKDLVDDGGTWVHHVVDDTENSLGSGNGVADALFTAAWARGQVIQYMLSGLERWSQGGILIAELQTMIAGELNGARYEAAKAQITKILQAAMRSGVVVVPQGDKVSITAPSEAWLNECITVLQYLDGIITQRVLMSVLPTGGGSDTGSLARAQEEGGTQMRVTLHDRARIQDTLDRDVLKVFWARNQETLALLSVAGQPLETTRPGTIRLGADGARESLSAVKDLVELVKVAPVRLDEFYDRVGLTPPRPEDKVVYLPVEQAKADKLEGQATEENAKADELDPSNPDDAQRSRSERSEAAYVAAAVKAGLVELVAGDLDFAAKVSSGRGWNLVYTWVAKDDDCTCKGCLYLSKNGPFTWGTLPTFPGTADTPCRERCRCILRARPASKAEHALLERRIGAGKRLEKIESLTGWVPATLKTIRETS